MDRFLEKFNLPRLNQEEIEIMNQLQALKLKLWSNIFQKTEDQDQMTSQENSVKLREELMPIFVQLSHKIERKEHFQTYFMRPPSLCYQNQTKTTQKKKTTGQYHW